MGPFAFVLTGQVRPGPPRWCLGRTALTPVQGPKAGRTPAGSPGSQAGPHSPAPSLSSPRCSTASTLSVRSSRAARRRKAARNRGQWTKARPVNSLTLTPCGRPVAAACCSPARAPARAHPTGSTNKGGSRHGVTGWAWMAAGACPPGRDVCGLPPPPHQGGAGPAANSTQNRSPPKDGRARFVLLNLSKPG